MSEVPAIKLKLAVRANDRVVFAIVHEDPDLLIIDKPAGLVVQPGKGHTTDSLLNGLFVKYGKLLHNLGERRDFGLLHRLDKDTSGLLVVAKSPNAYDQLRRDFEDRKMDKEYLAIVLGKPVPPQGVVQARLKEISEVGTGMKKVIISRQGKEAISAYHTVASNGKASLVRVDIKTGRLHQIRAHMMFLKTPVLGDEMYRQGFEEAIKKLPRAPRLCLHAAHLGFKHPITGKFFRIQAKLPRDLEAYGERLGLKV